MGPKGLARGCGHTLAGPKHTRLWWVTSLDHCDLVHVGVAQSWKWFCLAFGLILLYVLGLDSLSIGLPLLGLLCLTHDGVTLCIFAHF